MDEELNDRGFYEVECGECVCVNGDKCTNPRWTCDQCQALSINGTACHELGCPNWQKAMEAKRLREMEDEYDYI